jgi:hypothetical protein
MRRSKQLLGVQPLLIAKASFIGLGLFKDRSAFRADQAIPIFQIPCP